MKQAIFLFTDEFSLHERAMPFPGEIQLNPIASIYVPFAFRKLALSGWDGGAMGMMRTFHIEKSL